ncbi:MAG TPA: SCO family protein [Kofleriaceae bacterium]
MAGRSLLGVLLTAVLASSAYADGSSRPQPDLGEVIVPPPPTYKAGGVTVDEKLGAQLPLAAMFRTHEGKLVTLGSVLAGELPTILTFNYSDCPMLCSLQLNGLTAALPEAAKKGPVQGAEKELALQLGAHFRIVTISLEPHETLAKMTKMRDRYIERLPAEQRARARDGWQFLVAATPGDPAAIRRIAETVGFKYTYVTERAEWAHPAALIFLSTRGVVTRYVHGIEFPADMLRESIWKAGLAEPTTSAGFLARCYHYDPGANDHSRAGMLALRLGAAGFVVLLVGGFGLFRLLRRSRRIVPSLAPSRGPGEVP